MKLNLKLMLATIILLNMVFRYPDVFYETGSDSFGNHLLSQAILDNGSDNRFINILSFFGLFPGSNNMGGTFLLSTVSLISSLSVSNSIFVLPLYFFFLACFSMFLLCRQFTRNTFICLLAALLFTTSRKYIAFTDFTYSYRALYISMLPVLLFLAINLTKKFSKREIPWKLVILFILITVSMASIHRMTFMNGLVIFACISYLLLNSFSILEIYDKINIKLKIISTTSLVLLLYISSIYGLFFYSGSSEYTIEAGKRFFDSDFLPLIILNLGLSYAVQFGFILPLSAVGFFSLFKKFNKEYKLLLIIVALYSLIWTDLTYGSFVYLPFIVILVCLGFQFLFEIFKDYSFFGPQTYSYTFILILILQTIPEFVVVNKSTYAGFPESSNYSRDVEYVKAYDSGLYLSSAGESDTVLISHLASHTRIAIYSESPHYVESEMVNNSEFFTYEFTDISIFVTGKVNYIFEIEDDNLVRSFRYDVLFNDKKWDDSGNRINLNYVYKGEDQYILVLFRDISFILGDNGQWYESPFISSATNENYKFYDNGFHTLYNLAYNS